MLVTGDGQVGDGVAQFGCCILSALCRSFKLAPFGTGILAGGAGGASFDVCSLWRFRRSFLVSR